MNHYWHASTRHRAGSNPSGRYDASNYGVTFVKQFTWHEFTFHGFFFQNESSPSPPLHNVRVYIYIILPVEKNVSTKHLFWPRVGAGVSNRMPIFSLAFHAWSYNIWCWGTQTYPHLTTDECATCATIFTQRFYCVSGIQRTPLVFFWTRQVLNSTKPLPEIIALL
jgi:hypothetical protein